MKSSNNNQNQGFSDLQLQQLGQLIDVKLQPINARLDKIEVRLDHVKEQQKEIKTEMIEVKKDIKQINYRLDRIENCPTIKKELAL